MSTKNVKHYEVLFEGDLASDMVPGDGVCEYELFEQLKNLHPDRSFTLYMWYEDGSEGSLSVLKAIKKED